MGKKDSEHREQHQKRIEKKGTGKRPGCLGITREKEGPMRVLSEEVGRSQKLKNLTCRAMDLHLTLSEMVKH